MSTLISSAVATAALAASLGAGPAATVPSAATVAPAAFTQNVPWRPNPPRASG